MMDLITLNEARRKRHASRSSFVHSNTAPPLTAIERPKRLSGGWAHFEELVFKTLEKGRDLEGIDAVDRLSERLLRLLFLTALVLLASLTMPPSRAMTQTSDRDQPGMIP